MLKRKTENKWSIEYLDKLVEGGKLRGYIVKNEAKKELPKGEATNKWVGGIREDLDIYVRSGWEANYCRYLNFLIKHGAVVMWEYEPNGEEFWFPVKRGSRSYKPDFKVYLKDGSWSYHEVKGYMDKRSKTKLKRMARYYPDIKIELIDSDRYRQIAKRVSSVIPNWETRSRKK